MAMKYMAFFSLPVLLSLATMNKVDRGLRSLIERYMQMIEIGKKDILQNADGKFQRVLKDERSFMTTNQTTNQTTFLGISIGCLLWMALSALFIIGSAGFTVWYNYHITVPVQNSERYVQTCNTQYLTTQKAKISDNLDAISNIDSELADPNYTDMKVQLQSQQKQDARNIYNALDASQCSRQQIVKDMPELQSFFDKFPTR